MKFISVLFFLLSRLAISAQQIPKPTFKNGDRICFVGNSITHNGGFHHNILTYWATHFPKENISFFNAGIKGDVAKGVLDRIDSDIMIHNPTHIILMLGMNDVRRELYTQNSTSNLDTAQQRILALQQYENYMDSIIQKLIKKKLQIILQKPTYYDQTSAINYPNNNGANEALIQCGNKIDNLAKKYNLFTIDYNNIMKDLSLQMQAQNKSATLTVNDRVHPNNTGHFIMSYQFLKSTINKSPLSKIKIDVSKQKNNFENTNCQTTGYLNKKNVIEFTTLENVLPYPAKEKDKEALSLVSFKKEFNSQILQVKNLKKGTYQLQIDDVVINNFTDIEFNNGINLAVYTNTPQHTQAIQVHNELEKLWENEINFRAVVFVDKMILQNFENKNNIHAAKQYLDSIYVARFKGLNYYKDAFRKYITYKPKVQLLLQQADSLRKVIYEMAQPIPHKYIIKPAAEASVATSIEASQTSAAPLLFDVQPQFLVKEIANFNDEREFILRNGLPNFFNKIKKQNANLTIGFLGGSITKAEEQYRNQTLAYLQTLNKSAKLKGINAGVSGTGTELGACRVATQILAYNPDLVFIEFAVNGGSNAALEGIIRQIKKHNINTDICLIYTIAGESYKQYIANKTPAKIMEFEKVAEHYQIPSIQMGLFPSLLVNEEKLVWKSASNISDKLVFSKDGTHPTKTGGDLYAQAITRAFKSFETNKISTNYTLNKPLYIDNWEDANMYNPENIGVFSKDWKKENLVQSTTLKGFAPWFDTLYKTDKTNASFTFKFTGTTFGFFDIGGPEVGQIIVEIDGSCQTLKRKAGNAAKADSNDTISKCLINRFNSNCNNRYRGQFEMFEVPDGEHQIKISISNIKADKKAILQNQDLTDFTQFPDKYSQQFFYLGKILIKGKIKQ